MKLAVADKPNAPKYTSTYVIKARFMHGDADSYSTREWESPRQDAVKLAMKALNEVETRGELPEWYEEANRIMWHDANEYDTEADEGLYLLDSENDGGFPRDNPYCEHNARLIEFNLYCYDPEGNEYDVEVTY